MADGAWVIRAQLERPAARVWYREPFMYWIPVEQVGVGLDGRPILREVGRTLAGIWLAPEGSEVIHL